MKLKCAQLLLMIASSKQTDDDLMEYSLHNQHNKVHQEVNKKMSNSGKLVFICVFYQNYIWVII